MVFFAFISLLQVEGPRPEGVFDRLFVVPPVKTGTRPPHPALCCGLRHLRAVRSVLSPLMEALFDKEGASLRLPALSRGDGCLRATSFGLAQAPAKRHFKEDAFTYKIASANDASGNACLHF